MKILYAIAAVWLVYNGWTSIDCSMHGGTQSPGYWPPITQCSR